MGRSSGGSGQQAYIMSYEVKKNDFQTESQKLKYKHPFVYQLEEKDNKEALKDVS